MVYILVVDDDRFATTLVRFILSKEGYEVETTDNAHGAMQMIQNREPDLLILDQGVTVFGFLLRSKNAIQRTHGEGEPIPERRDEVMSEPGGCLTSLVDDHGTSWQEG